MLTSAELHATWKKRYKSTLDMIFEAYSSKGIEIAPDQAMEQMEELLTALPSGGVGTHACPNSRSTDRSFRFDATAFTCEAHHYAVDRYYKTYYGHGKGAPPLPAEYLQKVLDLRRQGLSYGQIAVKLGQNKEAVQQQVANAVRLWKKKVSHIHELARRTGQFVDCVK